MNNLLAYEVSHPPASIVWRVADRALQGRTNTRCGRHTNSALSGEI